MKIFNLFNTFRYRYKMHLLRKKGIKIGTNSYILTNYKTSFSTEPYLITIGNDVLVSAHCFFCPHDGATWVINNLNNSNFDRIGRITIGNNVYIGYGCTIFGNVNIGDNVIIGANSVVTKDVPNNSVCAGAPARVICSIDEYVKKNSDKFINTFHMNSKQKKFFLLNKYKNN